MSIKKGHQRDSPLLRNSGPISRLRLQSPLQSGHPFLVTHDVRSHILQGVELPPVQDLQISCCTCNKRFVRQLGGFQRLVHLRSSPLCLFALCVALVAVPLILLPNHITNHSSLFTNLPIFKAIPTSSKINLNGSHRSADFPFRRNDRAEIAQNTFNPVLHRFSLSVKNTLI
jgi:hypothetical protein